jgi:predicted metalloprotease with PDZ domain
VKLLPSFSRYLFRVCFFSLFFLATAFPSFSTIQYQISLAHPEQHLFHITMTIPSVSGSVTVQMPAWNALYEIRDFASHVLEVKASNESGPLPIEKLDKQTWRITCTGTITISYDTFWDEPGPFASQLNAEHAFINPAMILMYVPDRRSEDIALTFAGVPPGWNVATAAQMGNFQSGPNVARFVFSPGYDALADSPIEIGTSEQIIPPGFSQFISIVIHGKIEKRQDFEAKLAKICEYELSLMGGAPYERYLFIFHVGEGSGSGGMEHANSTAISGANENMLLSISAHEFFHLWNVKRIRPASLEPVDYTREQYTRSLWFAEGVTSTYERYALLRTGIWNRNVFYSDLGRKIADIESRPANKWQSAEQSSLDTWFEKNAIYNEPDHSVSYYAKGAILGVLLDLRIREQTNNARSLDDMMRAMNERFGKTGKPYRDHEDLENACTQIAKTSCKEFFDDYVSGTKPFPYDAYLAFAGLKIRKVIHSSPTVGTQTVFEISEDDGANEKQLRIRNGILKGITDQAAKSATAK